MDTTKLYVEYIVIGMETLGWIVLILISLLKGAMLNFLDYLIGCEVGTEPVILRFYINPNGNSEREINIMFVEMGKENIAMRYVEQYVVNIAEDADEVSYLPSWMFLIQNKRQMALIRPKAEFSFVMIENGTPIFYE